MRALQVGTLIVALAIGSAACLYCPPARVNNPVLIYDNPDPRPVMNYRFIADLDEAIETAGIEEPYRVQYIWVLEGKYSTHWKPGAAIWSAMIYKEDR